MERRSPARVGHGRTWAKAILLGEHSVVYGHPAVVLPLHDLQIRALIHDIAAEGAIDIALVAHGMLPDQHACQHDLAANRQALLVNAVQSAGILRVVDGR